MERDRESYKTTREGNENGGEKEEEEEEKEKGKKGDMNKKVQVVVVFGRTGHLGIKKIGR